MIAGIFSILFDSHSDQTAFLLSHSETICILFLGSTPVSQKGNFTDIKIRKVLVNNCFSADVFEQKHALMNTLVRDQVLIMLVFASVRNCGLKFPG